MIQLNNLKNSSLKRKNVQRVGRGPGTGRGKTSCRGQKGAGSRSGYKRRYGYEGGQMRLFAKTPCRGFTRGRFLEPSFTLNLRDIERMYSDGEVLNLATLKEKGILSSKYSGTLKILGNGELTKKITIEAQSFSQAAKDKLDEKKIAYKVL